MLSCPELLSPAGSLEALKYAVMYGADAVYCALPRFGMRAAPVNLTIGELHDGCIFAHARGKKVYLTLNNLPTNDELSELPQYIKDAAEAGVDAFIIADLGVLSLAKQYAPDVDVHFSTQAGITNYAAATMAYNLGAKRVVLARELTKTWETIHGAPVGELLAWVKEDENRRKGEMVLIVEGHKAQEDDLPADALRTLALLQAELPLKKAAALAAEIHGVKKNALYKHALDQQGE